MHAILVHGMGRTGLSMMPLARHLTESGLRPHVFNYFGSWQNQHECVARLKNFIETKSDGSPFIVIGHSLGTVLLRLVIPTLKNAPVACFFLAPPTVACRAAKYLQNNPIFRSLTGAMGGLLGNDNFMSKLPVPRILTTFYVGTGGPRRRWLPFQDAMNDGILMCSELVYPSADIQLVKSIHTYIMNSRIVIRDILAKVSTLTNVESVKNSSKPSFIIPL
jgi:hypothetical protein